MVVVAEETEEEKEKGGKEGEEKEDGLATFMHTSQSNCTTYERL